MLLQENSTRQQKSGFPDSKKIASKLQKCQEIFGIRDDARMTSNFLIIGIQNHVKRQRQSVKALHLQLPVRLLEGAPVRIELGKYKLLLK